MSTSAEKPKSKLEVLRDRLEQCLEEICFLEDCDLEGLNPFAGCELNDACFDIEKAIDGINSAMCDPKELCMHPGGRKVISVANIVSIKGVSKESKRRKIGEMAKGEVGYAVEWAVDEGSGELNTEFTIHANKGGTASMRVACLGSGRYAIVYERRWKLFRRR